MFCKIISIEKASTNSIKREFVKWLEEVKLFQKPKELERYFLSKDVIKQLIAKEIWTDEDIYHAEQIVVFVIGH